MEKCDAKLGVKSIFSLLHFCVGNTMISSAIWC